MADKQDNAKAALYNLIFILFVLTFFVWYATLLFTLFIFPIICFSMELSSKSNYDSCFFYPLLFQPVNWFWIVAIPPMLLSFCMPVFKYNSEHTFLLKWLIAIWLFWIIYTLILLLVFMEPGLSLEPPFQNALPQITIFASS